MRTPSITRPSSKIRPHTGTRLVRRLTDLIPDPQNANRGTDRGRVALERSLREFGAGRSVLLDCHGQIISGNKTVEQAKLLKMPVRVVRSDGDRLIAVQPDNR